MEINELEALNKPFIALTNTIQLSNPIRIIQTPPEMKHGALSVEIASVDVRKISSVIFGPTETRQKKLRVLNVLPRNRLL